MMYIDRDIGDRINQQVSLHLTTKNLKTIDVEVIDIREISHYGFRNTKKFELQPILNLWVDSTEEISVVI